MTRSVSPELLYWYTNWYINYSLTNPPILLKFGVQTSGNVSQVVLYFHNGIVLSDIITESRHILSLKGGQPCFHFKLNSVSYSTSQNQTTPVCAILEIDKPYTSFPLQPHNI